MSDKTDIEQRMEILETIIRDDTLTIANISRELNKHRKEHADLEFKLFQLGLKK